MVAANACMTGTRGSGVLSSINNNNNNVFT